MITMLHRCEQNQKRSRIRDSRLWCLNEPLEGNLKAFKYCFGLNQFNYFSNYLFFFNFYSNTHFTKRCQSHCVIRRLVTLYDVPTPSRCGCARITPVVMQRRRFLFMIKSILRFSYFKLRLTDIYFIRL